MTSRTTIAAGEVDLAVTDWGGSGPWLCFSHATGFCAGVWNVVARRFVGTHHAFGCDQRGHGDSSKPEDPAAYRWERLGEDVLAVFEGLDIDRADAVGHSSGAAALVLAASRQPDRFGKLVLIEPIIAPPLPEPTQQALEGPNPLIEGALRRRMVFPSREDMAARFSSRPPMNTWDPRVLRDYVECGSRDRPDGQVELKCSGQLEAEMYRQGARHGGYDALKDVQSPVLLLGSASPTSPFPLDWWKHLAELIPDVRFEVLEGLGHFAPMEDPDRIADTIASFLSP